MQQLLHAFRRLGSVLRGVLAPGVLVEVAAQLVQRVCTRVIGESPAGCCVLSGRILCFFLWRWWRGWCSACAPASLVSLVALNDRLGLLFVCGLGWEA